MPWELIIGLLSFSFVSSITPGPNNIMLLTSGVNYGFMRSIPHMLGITLGFLALLLAVGFGLAALLRSYPGLFTALKIAAALYLVYLSWRIAISRSLKSAEAGKGRPLRLIEAALFQFINPKAWAMSLTAMSLYVYREDAIISTFIVAVVFAGINLPCISCWTSFGTVLRNFLSVPLRLRIFNMVMGALLIASAIPIVYGDFGNLL